MKFGNFLFIGFIFCNYLFAGSLKKDQMLLVSELKEISFLYKNDRFEKKDFQDCHGIMIDSRLFVPDKIIFVKKMQKFLHHPVTMNNLKEICKAVEDFYADCGYIVARASLPQGQDITDGKVKVVVIIGRVGEIIVTGNRYFSSTKITNDFAVSKGKYITSDRLMDDQMWVNDNPFINADIIFAKSDNYGETDVFVKVKDRFPFRPFIGYENSGYKVATSQNRYFAGFNWGNVFNLAQQLNFQVMTTDHWNEWRGFTGSYIIPFKWRTSLKLLGNYVHSYSDKIQKSILVKGHSYQAGVRYEWPFVKWSCRHKFTMGYDYKYANNFESFITETIYNKNVVVSQFCLGYDCKESDKYGNTNANLYFYLSPGGMIKYNNDYYFNIQRTGARADYIYIDLTLERITKLGKGFTWVLNSFGKITGNKLLPSEEIAIGGFDTVRGYSQNQFLGDMGFVVRNEVRTPSISFKRTQGKNKIGLTQFLVFCDYGKVFAFDPNILNRKASSLLSAGPGLRQNISDYFNLRIDYGFQLKKALKTSKSNMGRLHVGTSLAY